MIRILFIIILSLLSLTAMGQKLTVDSFEQTTSLDGKKYARLDANDDPCALIKVQLALPNAVFEGNVVGEVAYKTSEYWVYMYTGSTKTLTVKADGVLPLRVYFPDYGIERLHPSYTYCLVLLLPGAWQQEAVQPLTASVNSATSDIFNGYDYVDLGLKDEQGRTIYWATCNVGASKPEEAGLFFAWGETQGYGSDTKDGREFDWANYKWCNGSKDTMTKYCLDSQYGTVDNETVLALEDDAAHVNWGGGWRMPTRSEQDQLRAKCKWRWDKKRKGYIVMGPNGNTLFLPAAGYRCGSSLDFAGYTGDIWSSSLDASGSNNACCLYFNSSYQFTSYPDRYNGQSVRAVCVLSE